VAAAPTTSSGDVRWTLTGVPAQLVRGRTIDLGYVIQNSSTAHVCIGEAALFIGRYFTDHGVGWEPVEMPVSVLNPVTRTWIAGSWAAGSGNAVIASWWNGTCYNLDPGLSVTIQVHVTVPVDAPAGKYEMNQIPGASSDVPFNSTGGFSYYTMIGSAAPGSPSPAKTTSPAPRQAPATAAATTHATTAAPTQTAVSSPSASPVTSSDAASTTSPTSSPIVASSTPTAQQPTTGLAAASTPNSGSGNSDALAFGVAGAVIVAAGAGTVLARRRRTGSTSE
jgi:hypothetical protein